MARERSLSAWGGVLTAACLALAAPGQVRAQQNMPAPLPVTATALTARTLTVSGWGEAWLQQAAADFDAANPGVRVVLHPEDPNSILRLEYEIDHGKAPDVVLLEASHFQSLLAKGREDKF